MAGDSGSLFMGSVPVVDVGGRPMPLIGLGMAAFPHPPPEAVKAAVLHAIRLGYRHFDTAAVYASERPLGEAIVDAGRQGLVASRDEVFVTTKLWCSDAHRGLVVPALENSLRNLGMQYVDLYLVHFPVSVKPGNYEMQIRREDLRTFDMAAVWEEMERCHRLGLAKAIGVSNFSCRKLELLLEGAKIPPAVNQVEMNPLWQQRKLRDFCAAKGIHVSAYSPLGARGAFWGSDQVMGNDVLKEVAEAKGRSVAQVCLRWVFEQGASVLVKSYSVKNMEDNLGILQYWELNEEDRCKISQIPQRKTFDGEQLCSSDGQYKSPMELWDGEI